MRTKPNITNYINNIKDYVFIQDGIACIKSEDIQTLEVLTSVTKIDEYVKKGFITYNEVQELLLSKNEMILN